MAGVRDLAYRFRRGGAPGAAAAAGVPVDRRSEQTAELEPVFALLAGIEARCDELERQARADAEGIRQRAEDAARDLVRDAQQRCERERAAVVERAPQAAADEAAARLAEARRTADAIRSRSAAMVPSYVAEVVDSVHQLLDGTADGAAPRTTRP